MHQTIPRTHRALPIELPHDASEAGALVLAYVQAGNTTFNRSAALEAASLRTAKLLEINGEQAEIELAQHAQITDALFQRMTVLSVSSPLADNAVKYLKAAMLTLSIYQRCLGAIEVLKQARLARTRVTIEVE